MEKSIVDYEEICYQVAGLLGATDDKIVERVRRLIMYLRANQWAVGELSILADIHFHKQKEKVLQKLEESTHKADALIEEK